MKDRMIVIFINHKRKWLAVQNWKADVDYAYMSVGQHIIRAMKWARDYPLDRAFRKDSNESNWQTISLPIAAEDYAEMKQRVINQVGYKLIDSNFK